MRTKTVSWTEEELGELSRLLLNGEPVRACDVRIIGGGQYSMYANVGDLIELLTDLAERSMDDNKQDAYHGLRMLLRKMARTS